MNANNKAIIKTLKKTFKYASKIIIKQKHSPSLLNGLLDSVDLSMPKNTVCQAGRNYLTIKADGSISPCHMFLDNPIASLNNKIDPIKKIESNKLLPREKFMVSNKNKCKDCDIRYLCGGGCPLLAKETTGSFNNPSPYCTVYKTLTPILISCLADVIYSLNIKSNKKIILVKFNKKIK